MPELYDQFLLFCSVPFDTKYETVLNALEDAKTHAVNGGDCSIYQW
jgi:hypothetical protein